MRSDVVAGSETSLRKGLNVGLVHGRVRDAILRGDIPAGTSVSQARLAQQLGVSRTPLREAMRLLEREGLIRAEANHRVSVAGLTIEDFEQVYAMRIALETIGSRLTVPRLTKEDLRHLDGELTRMRAAAEMEDFETFEAPHRAFHAGLVAHAGERLVWGISQLYDHAERYRRAYALEVPYAWSTTIADHERILDVCRARDTDLATRRLAMHYAVVALTLIAKRAPAYDPVAVRTALSTVTGEDG